MPESHPTIKIEVAVRKVMTACFIFTLSYE
jgi:hypothetical protein